MKRLFAGAALTMAAAVTVAAPAQAAPKDPVATLKKQLVPGTGVKFVDRAVAIEKGQREILLRRTGTFQFDKSGIAASDITGKFNIKLSPSDEELPEDFKAIFSPERTIRIGTTSYISGGFFSSMLPADKTWLKLPKGPTGGLTGMYGQLVNVTEPATLKTLLKGGKAAGGSYTGKITVAELYKVSPWFRASFGLGISKPQKKVLKSVISWKLALDAKGLPQRLVTTYPLAAIGIADSKNTSLLSVDTRFSGWGGKVAIEAPPADEVTTKFKDGTDELPSDLPMPDGSVVAK